jgi:transcription termination/antitermination protein NusG
MLTHGLSRRWHVLRTSHQCERLVADRLRTRGVQVFDPEMRVWSWRGRVRRASARPLFPGSLFLRHELDRDGFIRMLRGRGVVPFLAERWDRLSVVPDREIDAIRRVLDASLPLRPHPYVGDGRRVTIRRGSLAGIEGILLDTRPGRALLVLSVDLFRRSVAVEIDRTLAATV